MNKSKHTRITRRTFIKESATTTIGVSLLPLSLCSQKSTISDVLSVEKLSSISKRKFGNFDFEVTTMGLGGQGGLQWTPSDLDPAAVIVKAFKLGINYFDTSNLYWSSQLNYNKAFKALKLIPGEADYDEELRKSIWLTSKTHMRWGKPGWPNRPVVSNTSNGLPEVKCAIDDLKRSLTQIFGDNNGNYPEGSYLDMILIHSVKDIENIDVLYEGLETPLDINGNFGALVALRDFRDGTNLTGMNPNNEKLVRHIGFSGHTSPPAMVDMIQRDEYGILEAMLIAINPNDKTKYNMQYNVIPVAAAKGMGVIAMKVFADAALYHKEPRWSESTKDLFREVGTVEMPSKPLIEYSLSTPGVHTAIMGIGYIDEDPAKCQLTQNLNAAQIEPGGMTETDRLNLEELTKTLKPNSNYFQNPKVGLTKTQNLRNEGKTLIWDNAFAGDAPIKTYEIFVNEVKVGEIEHQPQTLKSMPFTFDVEARNGDRIEVVSVDANGYKVTESLDIVVSSTQIAEQNHTVQVFPNPAKKQLTIKGLTSLQSTVFIYNALGKKIMEKTTGGNQINLDVSGLRKGMYFLRFSDGSSKKFIKE